jgi:hypothetical protein
VTINEQLFIQYKLTRNPDHQFQNEEYSNNNNNNNNNNQKERKKQRKKQTEDR